MFRLMMIASAASACLVFGGCASIVSGQNQSLSVTTKNKGDDLVGAKCSLINDKGTWYATTPGSVTVRRSFNDLTINCALDGLEPGIAMVKSSTKGMAFGNILFGGIIGAGVDIGTGAAYDYPEIIVVNMGQTASIPAKNGTATTPAPAAPAASAPAVATATPVGQPTAKP